MASRTNFEKLTEKCVVFGNVHVCMLEDQIQKIKTDTRGVFQLYFYENLFGPRSDSAILSHETSNKYTVQTLQNELLSFNKETN